MFMPVLCPTCWNVVQASARSHLGILVREKHLDPLGGAGPDDCKRFATAYIEQFSKNRPISFNYLPSSDLSPFLIIS